MDIHLLRDLGWAALVPLALLLAIPVFATLYFCFSRPRRGLLLCILLLPIYLTYEPLLQSLAESFHSSQTLIAADILVLMVFAGFLLTRRAANILSNPSEYPITVGLLAFCAAALLSLAHSSSIPRSLMQLLAYCELLVLAFIVEGVPVNRDDLWDVLRYWMYSYGLVLGAGVLGVVSLWSGRETFAVFPSMAQVRATFRFPNQLSFYLAATLPIVFSLTLGAALPRRTRRWIWASLPMALVVLWFSGSRAGMGAVGVAAAIVGALHASRARAYVWGVVLLLTLGVSYEVSGLTASKSLGTSVVRYDSLLHSLRHPNAPGSEFAFYRESDPIAVAAFRANPIVGGGIGAVLNRSIEADEAFEVHMTYLGILGQTGLLGLGAFFLTLGFALRNLLRARKLASSSFVRELANGSLAALAGCFVHSLGSFDWRQRQLWVLLALTTIVWRVAKQEAWARQHAQTCRQGMPWPGRRAISAVPLISPKSAARP